PEAAAAARQGREADLRKQGVPHELARRLATLPALVAAPDIAMGPEPTGQGFAEVAAIYFAAAAFFRLDHIVSAARGIVISDYFDRLALDRALDSIGDAERRLTPAMARPGGAAALQALGGREPAGGFGEELRERAPLAQAQCLKCLVSVNTMAMPW